MSRTLMSSASAWVAAVLLAGCTTLEPAYHRPAPPVPPVFPQGSAGSSDAAAKAAADVPWRAFFLDAKLQATLALAIAQNRDLRLAVANIEAARAQYHVQRAGLFPQINAAFGADYARESASAAGFVSPGEPSHYDLHQFTASVGASSYTLDLFGRVQSLSKAALEQYFSNVETRRAAQITLISEVASDYMTLAADKATLQAARDTLTSATASLDIAQKRFQHGVASELDVDQAKTLVAQTRADVQNDLTTVAQDKNALDLVVGTQVPDALLPDALGQDVMTLAQLPANLPSDVLLQRPDVLEAEHLLRSQNAQIGAARAAFFPSISLTASTGATSPALSTLFKGASGQWAFEPQITLPIFAGGENKANLDYAKAERQAYLARYEKAIQSAFRDVADALARRATAEEAILANDAATQSAAQSLRLSEARYERGADTYLNVLIAQRTLYGAEEAQITARLTRDANLVTLYTALGGGVR